MKEAEARENSTLMRTFGHYYSSKEVSTAFSLLFHYFFDTRGNSASMQRVMYYHACPLPFLNLTVRRNDLPKVIKYSGSDFRLQLLV
jgi:hypothetical protein